MERIARQSTWLTVGGGLFLALAAFFLWRDLELPREMMLTVAALGAGAATVLRWPRPWPALAPAALMLATVTAALWFTAEKQAGLLPPLVVAVVAGLAGVVRAEREGRRELVDRLTWYAFGTALLAATWALYFHVFTAGFAADLVVRRLVPTLGWLAIGLAFFIGGRGRVPAAVHVGLGFIAFAIGKAAFYDTTHLHGGTRVLMLAAVGLLLLFGGRVLGRSDAAAGGAREERAR
jgi:hypothetical protein